MISSDVYHYVLLTLIVSHYIKSRQLGPGLPHRYVNFSGHQLDEPTGFSGGLEQ